MKVALNLLVQEIFRENAFFSEKISLCYFTKNIAQSLALCGLLRKCVENVLLHSTLFTPHLTCDEYHSHHFLSQQAPY